MSVDAGKGVRVGLTKGGKDNFHRNSTFCQEDLPKSMMKRKEMMILCKIPKDPIADIVRVLTTTREGIDRILLKSFFYQPRESK